MRIVDIILLPYILPQTSVAHVQPTTAQRLAYQRPTMSHADGDLVAHPGGAVHAARAASRRSAPERAVPQRPPRCQFISTGDVLGIDFSISPKHLFDLALHLRWRDVSLESVRVGAGSLHVGPR